MSMGLAGFRSVKVLLATTGDTLSDHGDWIYAEVTNNGASDVTFSVNDYTSQGSVPSPGIPIKAGTTRNIPMAIYNFTATGPVDVVAYRM